MSVSRGDMIRDDGRAKILFQLRFNSGSQHRLCDIFDEVHSYFEILSSDS